MSTTIEDIYSAVKSQLGDRYTVLSSYDANEDVNPAGCIAVNVGEFEHLDHNGCNDYRFGVSVSGFTLADEDKSRSIIYAMEAYVLQHINLDALKESVTNCAGAVMGNLTTQSDGDSNEFTLNFDIYVCDAIFVDA
jgi:hypothetical protein